MLGPGEGARMEIPIADAIAQLRDQLRACVLEGKDQDICFTPDKIEVELAVTFKAEATAKGGSSCWHSSIFRRKRRRAARASTRSSFR
jgi:Trypsin-co-occurring domain 2